MWVYSELVKRTFVGLGDMILSELGCLFVSEANGVGIGERFLERETGSSVTL